MEMQLKHTNLDFYLTRKEIIGLLSEAEQIGYSKGLRAAGKLPALISQNRAYKEFTIRRVKDWVNDGLIVPKPGGNGKTSTVLYEYDSLVKLAASDKIKIRKPYIS